MSDSRCVMARESSSRIQYSVEGVFALKDGRRVPFYVTVLPNHAVYQTVAGSDGEKLTDQFIKVFGNPSGEPTVVRGGACGGEVGELAGELDLHGAMVSLLWDGEDYDRERFIETLKELLGSCL